MKWHAFASQILPTGVNKASGLQAALEICSPSPARVIGVGDAENDHAFPELCGLPVAVANALPALKERATLVTKHRAGAGVTERVDAALPGDLDRHIRVEAEASR
jgi:hydroxymethylpyrimidine pyrophosphatase-like HAD family hydrolase